MEKEIKCPWCGEINQESEVKVGQKKNDFGGVVERRCASCGQALAAYREDEGNFLRRIRKF